MKKIKNFDKYVKENILFPRGGNIGGEHKKPVTDEEIESGKAKKKGYIPQKGGYTHSAHNISIEKQRERKINLMGDELSGYFDKDNVKRLIDSVEYYKKDLAKYIKSSIKDYLSILPKGVIDHFNIDLDSENLVENFIEDKFELFKRSYDMFKEIKK